VHGFGWLGGYQEPTGSCRSYHITVVNWQLSNKYKGLSTLGTIGGLVQGSSTLSTVDRG